MNDQLLQEVADALEITGVRLTVDQVRTLVADDEDLLDDVQEWGTSDTEVLGQLANLLSQHLLGEAWPTYGRGGSEIDAFTARLLASASSHGYAVSENT